MEPIKIHFGCGGNILKGWINHDMDVDMRCRLPFDSETVDAVFTEHTIEHLSSSEMVFFLCESFRILRKGGWIRVVFPDIEKICLFQTREYCDFSKQFTPADRQSGNISTVWSISSCHGHKQVLTSGVMFAILRSIGFESYLSNLYGFQGIGGEIVDGHWKSIGNKWFELESVAVEGRKTGRVV